MPSVPTALSRAGVTGVAGALAALGLIGLTAPSASAASADSRLCSDYATCAAGGMGDHGYAAVQNISHWGMYGGHNCTNYVAYALTQEGVRRPSYRLGNAADWGPAARAAGVPVDDSPAVGAVAWWSSGAGGVSWAGHVAIVERVDAASITISEDNYPAGPFGWRVIARTDTSWPTGFIHFGVAVAPRRPSIALGAAGVAAVAATRSDGALVLATRTSPGSAWTSQTVAPAGSAFGAPSLVLGAAGLAEIAVQGNRGSLVVYGRQDLTSGWTAETVAGPGAITAAPTAVLTGSGQLQVVARAAGGALTVYSALVGRASLPAQGASAAGVRQPVVRVWTTTQVAGAGAVVGRPAATLDSSGVTRVAVLGPAHRLLLFSGRPGQLWRSGSVAPAGAAYAAPSIVDGPGAQLQVSTLAADGSVDVYGRVTAGAASAGPWILGSLSGPGAATTPPVLVVGPDGVTEAATTTSGGAVVLLSSTPAAAGWGPQSSAVQSSQTVAPVGSTISPADAIVDSTGSTEIVSISPMGVLEISGPTAAGAWNSTVPAS